MLFNYSKYLLLLVGILFNSCSSKEPSPSCQNAGKFIMTLKNEEGLVNFDTTSRQFMILFSPDGSLEYSTAALPCNLKPEYQFEYKVRFDADLFELEDDSLLFRPNTLSMSIRKIEFL